MDRFAFDKIRILLFADFVFHLVDRQLRLEIEHVVQHFHAQACDVIEHICIRAVFFVEDIRQREKFFIGFKDRVFHALEAHAAIAEIFLDPERDEGALHYILI